MSWGLPPNGAKDARQWLQRQTRTLNGQGIEYQHLGKQFSKLVTEASMIVELRSGERIAFIDSERFATQNYPQNWLVRNVLVENQPVVVGGPRKSLKTSIILDLAVSVATERKFLGHFPVPKKRRVGVLCGESGPATLQETFFRICKTKGINDPKSVDIHWSFKLPQLSRDEDLADLQEQIEASSIEVVILDPLYLCLLSGNPDLQAQNMFHMGPLLARIAEACLTAGATPILLHHTKKGSAMPAKGTNYRFEPPDLEDLAYAGVQEFARQWMLIGRREKYEPGTGRHQLWFNVGGSAGHNGLWGVDVNEGMQGADFGGRRWDVQVRTATEQFDEIAKEKSQKSAEAKRHKDEPARKLLLGILREHREGETQTAIAEAADVGKGLAKRLLDAMVREGTVERCSVEKRAGRSSKTHPAFRLVKGQLSRSDVPTDEDDDEDDDEK